MSTATSDRAGAGTPPNRRASCRTASYAIAAFAGAAWAAVITADAVNLEDHIWECLLVLAGISTAVLALTGMQRLMLRQLADVNERIDRQFTEMTRLIVTRPGDPQPAPPPWPRASGDDWHLPGGDAVPFRPGIAHGRHATSGRARP